MQLVMEGFGDVPEDVEKGMSEKYVDTLTRCLSGSRSRSNVRGVAVLSVPAWMG